MRRLAKVSKKQESFGIHGTKSFASDWDESVRLGNLMVFALFGFLFLSRTLRRNSHLTRR